MAPPFSWREAPSPNLGFDYVLLLGVLLAAADLAYVEVRFTPLGAHWPWHLLIVAAFTALAAFRFDSRVVFSLALSTFAAWRGVSVAWFGSKALDGWGAAGDLVRWNAIGCGVLFVLLGFAMARTGRKAHFEPVATYLGWLLLLASLASGIGEPRWTFWNLGLLLAGAVLTVGAWRFRRFPLFAYGVLAVYGAVTRLALAGVDEAVVGCFWFFATPLAVLGGLIVAHRRMKEPA